MFSFGFIDTGQHPHQKKTNNNTQNSAPSWPKISLFSQKVPICQSFFIFFIISSPSVGVMCASLVHNLKPRHPPDVHASEVLARGGFLDESPRLPLRRQRQRRRRAHPDHHTFQARLDLLERLFPALSLGALVPAPSSSSPRQSRRRSSSNHTPLLARLERRSTVMYTRWCIHTGQTSAVRLFVHRVPGTHSEYTYG